MQPHRASLYLWCLCKAPSPLLCENTLCVQEGNLLTGSIPPMAGLQSVSYFSASFNPNLSGGIPLDWLVPSLLGAAALPGLAMSIWHYCWLADLLASCSFCLPPELASVVILGSLVCPCC